MASKPDKTSIHKSSKPNLGKKIIALRTYLELNQVDFGKRVGTSAMSISRWECESHRPTAHYLIKLGLLANPDDCWFFWGQAGLTVADVMRVMPAPVYNLSVSNKRFSELQDEFFATSKRLRLAQKPEDKLALLNELQRIVKESKQALADSEPRNKK